MKIGQLDKPEFIKKDKPVQLKIGHGAPEIIKKIY